MGYSSPSSLSLWWANTALSITPGSRHPSAPHPRPLQPSLVLSLLCNVTIKRRFPDSLHHLQAPGSSQGSASAVGNAVPGDGGCPCDFQPTSLLLLLLASCCSPWPRIRAEAERWGGGVGDIAFFVCLFRRDFFERHGKSTVRGKRILMAMEYGTEKSFKPGSCG